jgi:PAS domain S-box-containing protein
MEDGMQIKGAQDLLKIFSSSDLGMIICDTAKQITGMNELAQSVLDLELDKVKGHRYDEYFKLINKDGRELLDDCLAKNNENHFVVLPSPAMLVTNDRTVNIAGLISPIKCLSESPHCLFIIFIDIEKKYISVDTLKHSEEFYRSLFDTMTEGYQIIGYDWKYIYLNDAAVNHAKKTRNELIDRTMMQIYTGIEDTEMFSVLRDCMENRVPHDIENLFTFPDGSQRWFHLRIRPVPEGVYILSLDIGERKEMERKIIENQV